MAHRFHEGLAHEGLALKGPGKPVRAWPMRAQASPSRAWPIRAKEGKGPAHEGQGRPMRAQPPEEGRGWAALAARPPYFGKCLMHFILC